MKPITQTKLQGNGVNGNCLAAVMASLFEISIDEVPQFEDMEEQWGKELLKYIDRMGFELWGTQADPGLNEYYVALGQSPRGISHAVVYYGGRLVHDPHPSRAGLAKTVYFWIIRPKK